MRKKFCLLFSLLLLASPFARAGEADGFQHLTFTVDGVVRTALIYAPPTARSVRAPLVFVLHGHGGNARQVAHSYALNRQWPEAISVYMQGLDTPGQLTDPQAAPGDQGDRNLKFFDVVPARLKQDYDVDTRRIYCTGHSNGGGFTFLDLWTRHQGPSINAGTGAAQALPPKLT